MASETRLSPRKSHRLAGSSTHASRYDDSISLTLRIACFGDQYSLASIIKSGASVLTLRASFIIAIRRKSVSWSSPTLSLPAVNP